MALFHRNKRRKKKTFVHLLFCFSFFLTAIFINSHWMFYENWSLCMSHINVLMCFFSSSSVVSEILCIILLIQCWLITRRNFKFQIALHFSECEELVLTRNQLLPKEWKHASFCESKFVLLKVLLIIRYIVFPCPLQRLPDRCFHQILE